MKLKINRTRLPKTAEACDRYLVSDRAGAAIASAVLTDYGLITDQDKTHVIGPRKLADERHKYRMSLLDNDKQSREEITSIYFDGKKIPTRTMIQNSSIGRWSPRLVVEDHYVIMVEPGSEYLTQVTTTSGHGKTIAKAINIGLEEHAKENNPICAVGADGTSINVGAENGAIHWFEMIYGRPLHYFICQ